MARFIILLLLYILLLYGCSPFSPPVRNMEPEKIPSVYSMFEEGSEVPKRWWRSFNKKDLNNIVEKALKDNFTIRESWAKLKQAGASAKKESAELFPAISGEAGGSNSTSRTKGSSKTENNSFSIGLAAAYELDLWGQNRAFQHSEELKFGAAGQDLNSAAMTVAASITEAWVDYISIKNEIRLLRKQLKTNETVLKLQRFRYEKSIASALDVLQQMEVVAQVKSQIPPLESELSSKRNMISFLIGEPPGSELQILKSDLPSLPELPETGIPADILSRRPDVKAAGLRLKAADWEVSASKADRLPSISLSGSASYSGSGLKTLLDTWTLNLASNITGPIFDAGRRKAEVNRTLAVVEERLATYEKAVFTALMEVENQLYSEKKQKEHVRALENQLTAARRAYAEAERRYNKGIATFIPFLTEMLNVQKLERELVRERTRLIKIRIGLYRALGGDWGGVMNPEKR